MKKNLLFCLLAALAAASVANAEVEIDQDAITRESVYPKFDDSHAVENRTVPQKSRIQAGLWGGERRNDPYFKSFAYGADAAYSFTNEQAVQLLYALFSNSQSQESVALNNETGAGGVKNLNLAPSPNSLWLVSYKLQPFYGKVSFSKLTVFNMSLYGTVGYGQMMYSGANFPVFSIGAGDDLFFNKSWGMTLDIRGLYYQGPDATSKNLSSATSKPEIGEFSDTATFNFLIHLGVMRLF